MESDNQTHRAGSLFVLHDELGYPQKAEVSPIPAERVNMPFMAFIRKVYEVNRHGWYVPKGSICCYDMTGVRISVATARALCCDGDTLAEFLLRQTPAKMHDLLYRIVHCISSWSGQPILKELSDAAKGVHPRQKVIDT